MLRSKLFLSGLIGIFLLNACIEELDIENVSEHEANVVVSGWITDLAERQFISLSESTPLNEKYKKTLENCHVEVHDDKGNVFIFTETYKGNYYYDFKEADIQIGNSYKLIFVTPEGVSYESDFEKLQPVPGVESLVYKKEDKETRDIGVTLSGVQFYTDIESNENFADYYKMEMVETYEFHTYTTDVHWLYDREIVPYPSDSMRKVCYITDKLSNIFLANTNKLSEKKILNFPLNFVSNRTQRLQHGYSLQLRLLSLSASAHNYWSNQKAILEESGGLFERQPPSVSGNIYNMENPDERVLGYFGVSAVATKRIYVPQGVIAGFDIEPYCVPSEVTGTRLAQMFRTGRSNSFFTYAYNPLGMLTLHFIQKNCFDCTVFDNSTTEKPEFWEE